MADNRTAKPRPARRRSASAPVPAAETAREPTKRLTLDVPESLHFAMRMRAAETGIDMVKEVTPLLLAHYAEAMRRFPKR